MLSQESCLGEVEEFEGVISGLEKLLRNEEIIDAGSDLRAWFLIRTKGKIQVNVFADTRRFDGELTFYKKNRGYNSGNRADDLKVPLSSGKLAPSPKMVV